LSLENKKKSRKPATFWALLNSLLLDPQRFIILDKGESLKDLKAWKEVAKAMKITAGEEVKSLEKK
jgi:hypothetical protein